jgi:hypothetical protein
VHAVSVFIKKDKAYNVNISRYVYSLPKNTLSKALFSHGGHPKERVRAK